MRGMYLRIILTCILGLGVSACGGKREEATAPADSRPVVAVRALQDFAAPAGGSAAADVIARNDSTLTAEVAAQVARIGADAGARVEAGRVLVELDPADYRLALEQARAQAAAARSRAELAQARLLRGRRLNTEKYVSDDELAALEAEADAARAEARVREAGRAVAERELGKTRIRAPFDGVVLERMAQVGAAVVPGTPLLRIVDLAVPEVETRLQSAQATALERAGDAVLEAGGREWPLRLLRVADAVDATSRTRVARLAFTGEAPAPGTSGTLRWTQQGGWRIPSDLLVRRGEAYGVFVGEDGRARFVPLPGAQPGRGAGTTLPGTSQLVIEGHQALQDGQSVRLRNAESEPPTATAGGANAPRAD
ncbi:efflux RND transporter periplasmic adaptor subunit [soil metagenome]